MDESQRGEWRSEHLANGLSIGLAIADVLDWRVGFTNSKFDDWFPSPRDSASLGDLLVGLDTDRARRRIEKGRPYAFESELKSGARPKVLRTTIRAAELGDQKIVLAETTDCTKQKEQEHMLDSFANLADRNKRQLEQANQALAEKAEEIRAAYDVIKSQKDRMERELQVARRVQMNMLPTDFVPNHKECTVAGTLKPALEVGGDFFDFFYVDRDRLCFVVGDVSDKGTASGLFMAASKTLIKAHAVRAESTAGIVARVNKELSRSNESCMFVTLFLAILDLTSGAVVCTNAGHNPPYLIRSGQDPELVRGRHGPALGVVEDAEFTEAAMTLGRGDMMVVHTDGVNEAMSRDGEMFGQERLEGVLGREDCGNAEGVVRTIANAVAEFEEGTQQTDDVTVIAVKFHGA